MDKTEIADLVKAMVEEAVAAAREQIQEEESGLRSRLQDQRSSRVDANRERRRIAGEKPPDKTPQGPKTQQAESKVVVMTITPPPSKIAQVPVDADADSEMSLPPYDGEGPVFLSKSGGVLSWVESSECASDASSS